MKTADVINGFDLAHPALRGARESLENEWQPQSVPLTLVFSAYADPLCEHASQFSDSDREDLFRFVERVLEMAEDDVKNAVATGFLERLLGQSSAGKFDFRQVAPFLGPGARLYCREWDKFCGITTPGL